MDLKYKEKCVAQHSPGMYAMYQTNHQLGTKAQACDVAFGQRSLLLGWD